MGSLILRTATRFLMTLLILFSIFLLLRGHNEPGGGFVGGLVAAGAFVLYAIAYDVSAARYALRINPIIFIGVGLLVAVSSGIFSLLAGDPYMTGQWGHWKVPLFGSLDVGTPVIFDVGVYLVVLGVTLTIILALAEE